METINKKINPKEVTGWTQITPLLVDHGNSRPIKYKITKPAKETSKAVFYLHGLGGDYSECPEYDQLFCETLNLIFVRIEYPLIDENDPMKLGAVLVGINPGTVFQLMHNTSKLIDQISKNENFDSIGIVGVSYGGFNAIINAIRGLYAQKVLLLSSTPDIALAIENFHNLFPNILAKNTIKLVATNFRIEARNIRQGKGLFKGNWNKINPWTKPMNNNVEILCLGNQNDPIMVGNSLHHYKNWMAENYIFNNITLRLFDGPLNHTEYKGTRIVDEFRTFFKNF